MRRRQTVSACMVRRRSTVRFRNGTPRNNQVRSSLDSSHLTLWMGAAVVLGGIWEIVSVSGPTELARSAREGQPGDAGFHDGNRKPAVPSHWDTLSTAVSPDVDTDAR